MTHGSGSRVDSVQCTVYIVRRLGQHRKEPVTCYRVIHPSAEGVESRQRWHGGWLVTAGHCGTLQECVPPAHPQQRYFPDRGAAPPANGHGRVERARRRVTSGPRAEQSGVGRATGDG